MMKQKRKELGIDFNFRIPSPYCVGLDGKVPDCEYLNIAQQFCRSKKNRMKARWMRKFSRKLTQAVKNGTVMNPMEA